MQEKSGNKKREETEMTSSKDSAGLFMRDGMSTATARFIIERDVGEKMGEVSKTLPIPDVTISPKLYGQMEA